MVTKIDTRGKIVIQLQDSNEVKKVSFASVYNARPIMEEWPFKIETFAQHEDALRVATSLFSLLSQDFKIDKDKWKIVSDNSDSINMALLRQQQLRLAIIKAVKLFFANQNVLRHILKQSAIHLEEDKKDVNLLQKLLSKATHPSPVKVSFFKSQTLSSNVNHI